VACHGNRDFRFNGRAQARLRSAATWPAAGPVQDHHDSDRDPAGPLASRLSRFESSVAYEATVTPATAASAGGPAAVVLR
jgi:hypothetical protein